MAGCIARERAPREPPQVGGRSPMLVRQARDHPFQGRKQRPLHLQSIRRSTLPVLTPVRVGDQDEHQWEMVVDTPALRALPVVQQTPESLFHQAPFIDIRVKEEQHAVPQRFLGLTALWKPFLPDRWMRT